MNLKVKELKQEIKALRNILKRNIKAKYDTKAFCKITLADWDVVENRAYSTLRKAELEELYAELIAFRNKFDAWVLEEAEEQAIEEFGKEMVAEREPVQVGSCPAVESMLAEAFSQTKVVKAKKEKRAKKEPKYGTVEKRQQLVADKMKLAEDSIKDEDMKVFIGKGNLKLNGILTYSMMPVATCPSATDNCIMKCYALKDYYRNWDNVSKSQYINYLMSQREDFVEIMTKMLKIEALTKDVENTVNGTEGILTVRIHVSGDFYSQEYFEKWVQITENLKGLPIQFGCYTKSIQYIKNHMKRTGKKISDININFMFSLWDDTKEKFVKMSDEMNMNIFTAYNKKTSDVPTGYIACPDDINKGACGTTCNMCYEKSSRRKKIAIAIH